MVESPGHFYGRNAWPVFTWTDLEAGAQLRCSIGGCDWFGLYPLDVAFTNQSLARFLRRLRQPTSQVHDERNWDERDRHRWRVSGLRVASSSISHSEVSQVMKLDARVLMLQVHEPP